MIYKGHFTYGIFFFWKNFHVLLYQYVLSFLLQQVKTEVAISVPLEPMHLSSQLSVYK